MSKHIGEKAMVKKHILGALEKRIIECLSTNGPKNKNAITKLTHSNYKSVYYAVDRLEKEKGLVHKVGVEETKKKRLVDVYGLTLDGFDKALNLGIVEPKQGYHVIKRNKIDVPLWNLQDKMGIMHSFLEPIISKFDLEKFRELTLALMAHYPTNYFNNFKYLETDPDLKIRLSISTILLYFELFKSGKLENAPEPIPKLLKALNEPLQQSPLKYLLSKE